MFDAQAGAVDEADFRALYDAASPPLHAYLLHVCRRPDVADDLLQETYCRYLMRRRPVMDASQTRSWLFRIATNLLHDRGRSRIDAFVPEFPSEALRPTSKPASTSAPPCASSNHASASCYGSPTSKV